MRLAPVPHVESGRAGHDVHQDAVRPARLGHGHGGVQVERRLVGGLVVARPPVARLPRLGQRVAVARVVVVAERRVAGVGHLDDQRVAGRVRRAARALAHRHGELAPGVGPRRARRAGDLDRRERHRDRIEIHGGERRIAHDQRQRHRAVDVPAGARRRDVEAIVEGVVGVERVRGHHGRAGAARAGERRLAGGLEARGLLEQAQDLVGGEQVLGGGRRIRRGQGRDRARIRARRRAGRARKPRRRDRSKERMGTMIRQRAPGGQARRSGGRSALRGSRLHRRDLTSRGAASSSRAPVRCACAAGRRSRSRAGSGFHPARRTR